MIKTLRITSIIAVVLAVVFFAFPAVFGVRGNKQIEQFLNSAGAIEEFKEARGYKVEDRGHEISPLVKQAEAFALYLNPPPKPSTKPSVAPKKPRPKSVSSKFRLVGTSRHALQPELSLALIDEPGKGLRWVRSFSKVGHLIIEEIKDGLVVIRDGERTFELVAERPEKRSLIKERPEKRSLKIKEKPEKGRIPEKSAPSVVHAADSGFSEDDAEDQISDEEREAAEAEMKRTLAELDTTLLELEKVQVDVEADLSPEEQEVEMLRKKLISDFETMRISAKEARGLGRLGRRLKNVRRKPNRVKEDRTERDVNLIDPNLTDVNIPD